MTDKILAKALKGMHMQLNFADDMMFAVPPLARFVIFALVCD